MTDAVTLKRSEVFLFEDGMLTVKVNGWSEFFWDEAQIEYVPYDEKAGQGIAIEIPKSELIELRDFLMRLFPPIARSASPQCDLVFPERGHCAVCNEYFAMEAKR